MLYMRTIFYYLILSVSVNNNEVSTFTLISPIRNKSLNRITQIKPIFESTSNSESKPSKEDFSFFDEATIHVRAGSGGQGASTYKIAKKKADGTPDGGSGGIGGDVILVLDDSLNTLAGLCPQTLRPNSFGGGGAASSSKRNSGVDSSSILSFRAEGGYDGGRMYDNGRKGLDCEVHVPPGTVVSIEHPIGDNEYSLEEIGSVTHENPSLLVAKGGLGGEGTGVLKNKKKGSTRRGPQGGQNYRLRLTLKIVADIALVGLPNAGKSTFLASVTRAKPRIADYPFTTVIPNLGTWIPPVEGNNNQAGSSGLVLCDVPGLIEGASKGVGLGHAFLRHIERCRVILHLIDATSPNPIHDFQMVNEEIKKYANGDLASKPQVVVVNKIDLAGLDEEGKDGFKRKFKEVSGHTRLMWVSAKERDGVDDLMIRMAGYVQKIKQDSQAVANR